MEPRLWTQIDQIARAPKRFLTSKDLCFYYLQKDKLGYGAGPHAKENQLIINFKHDPAKHGQNQGMMYYKREATNYFARAVAQFFEDNEALSREGVSLVPIPTSKPRTASDYDPRLDNLCRLVQDKVPFVTFHPALETIADLGKVHANQIDRDSSSIMQNLSLDTGMLQGSGVIALVDDVLTTGAHYAACRRLISTAVPNAPLLGLFLSIQLLDPQYDDSNQSRWY